MFYHNSKGFTMHIFMPINDGFYDSTDWVEVDGIKASLAHWQAVIDYVDANDLWEPCSHGWECWLD